MNLNDVDKKAVAEKMLGILQESMTFSMYLKTMRMARLHSKLELAAKAGISESTLRALENGQRAPAPETLAKLVDALELGKEQRAFFLQLAAEAQMKTVGKSKRKSISRKSRKMAILTPIAEDERAMLTEMLGEGWETRGQAAGV